MAAPNEVQACIVALGGNVGPVAETFCWALQALQQQGLLVVCVSRIYLSRAHCPEGGAPQPHYLNAACLVHTALPPAQVLAILLATERRAGPRGSLRWAPRRLDLDLISYNNFYTRGPVLTLPHPLAHGRAFVLQPACDIAPNWLLDAQKGTFCACLAALNPGEERCLASWLSWPAAHRGPPTRKNLA